MTIIEVRYPETPSKFTNNADPAPAPYVCPQAFSGRYMSALFHILLPLSYCTKAELAGFSQNIVFFKIWTLYIFSLTILMVYKYNYNYIFIREL